MRLNSIVIDIVVNAKKHEFMYVKMHYSMFKKYFLQLFNNNIINFN